jgi:hypothetical protein
MTTAARQSVTHIRESQQFKSMYTLWGKLNTHNMYAFCVSPRMSLIRFLRTILIHGNLSWSHQQSWTDLLLPRKKGSCPNPQHADWPIHGCIPSFSPTIAIEAVEKSQAYIDNKLHRFTELISLACDQYVQYLLMGVNPSVLNRHRQGLQPCRCRLSTSYSPPFPFGGPPLFPNGPSGLRLIIST